MANVPETIEWIDGIYQIESTDSALGGAGRIPNRQAQQLGSRTQFLRKYLGSVEGITLVSESKVLTVAECDNKLIGLSAINAQVALKLPAVNSDNAGLLVRIKAISLGRQARIYSDNQIDFNGIVSNIYLASCEDIELLWSGSSWLVISFNGNFFELGKVELDYSIRLNTVTANGQLLSRTDNARLWEWIQANSNSLVGEFTWQNTAGYKGFFSTGDGSTNFRVPDLRGMFFRALDQGAGISLGRNNSNPGGYEADLFKSHSHNFNTDGDVRFDNNENGFPFGRQNGDNRQSTVTTSSTGGAETRPKNIGLIPLIKV